MSELVGGLRESAGPRWHRGTLRNAGRAVLGAAALGGAALGTLAALLGLLGADVGESLAALWRGAAGSPDALLSATLVRATPLVLAGLGVAIAFRGGVLNIGAEGQLLAGATAAAAVGVLPLAYGAVWPATALVAAALAGSAWAAGPAWLKRRFGALEVISTIMLNFVAVQLVGFLVRGPLQEPSGVYPQSPEIAVGARLPVVVTGSRLHAGVLVAFALVAAATYGLGRTAAGFRLRAVGLNPEAAASAGLIDVARVQTRAFLASGALAGLAGGVQVLGVTFALYENLSPGYGYSAIAVALLGRLHPVGVVVSGLLLGGLSAGAAAMQRDAGVPAGVTAVVEAVLVLGLLAAQAVAPASAWWRLTNSARPAAPAADAV